MALTMSVVASACGSDSGGETSQAPAGEAPASVDPADVTGTIRLLSYTDGFQPDYLKSFYKQYPNIELETAAMGSNEEAVAKIQAGFEVDVVNSCVDEATLEMVQKGMYMPLDAARLTHWNDLFPSMQALPGVQVVEDAAEVIARDDVEAVVVCAATPTLAQIAAAVAAGDQHHYLEKPIALTAEEARTLEEGL